MPTNDEIAAAVSTLTVAAQANLKTAETLEAQRDYAQKLDDLATAIETDGYCLIGHSSDKVKISGAAAVAQVVTYLRARAAAARDAITLPG